MSEAPPREGDTLSAELGLRLRAARAKAGMTRKQLAAASGASQRYLANLEAGTGNPSLILLVALAESLDLAPAELLPLSGERTAERSLILAEIRRLPAGRFQDLQEWIAHDHGRGRKAARIVLLGLRGAGKSSLGKALAKRLDAPFLELSKEVESAYGGDIGVLIELGGQQALRRYERSVWQDICVGRDRAVVAASGGVVADGPLFERVLESAHTIWLQASPEDHMRRVMSQGDFRPMASNRDAMADLKAILAARSADYGRAEAILDTSAQPYEATLDVLQRVAEGLLR